MNEAVRETGIKEIRRTDSVRSAIRGLSNKDSRVRVHSAIFLASCVWEGKDISRAIPILEKALLDEDAEVRRNAASALENYALLTWKIDLSPSLKYFSSEKDVFPTGFPVVLRKKFELAVSGRKSFAGIKDSVQGPGRIILLPHGQPESIPYNGLSSNRLPMIALSTEANAPVPGAKEIYPVAVPEPVSYRAVLSRAQRMATLPGSRITPNPALLTYSPSPMSLDTGIAVRGMKQILLRPVRDNAARIQPSGPEDTRVRKKRKMTRLPAALAASIFILLLFTFQDISTSSTSFRTGQFNSPAVSDGTGEPASAQAEIEPVSIEEPEYFSSIDTHRQRFIEAEMAVFEAIRDEVKGNAGFAEWFNQRSEEQKRGFILFVRSGALKGILGNTIHFSKKQWLLGSSEQVGILARDYLKRRDPMSVAAAYEKVYRRAEEQRKLFLSRNEWLAKYLDSNYSDFEKGLFFFFAEHSFRKKEVLARSRRLASLRKRISSAVKAILADRENRSRISAKMNVSDDQIREIVTAAFFSDLFYGVPAGYITLITAYETNFSMEYWEGGYGATQQTRKAANTVLQSNFWIEKVKEIAGAPVSMQMVPISALDNVFLCIIEAAKTIAVKAAELNVPTEEIRPARKVEFEGKPLPVTWVAAYKYNGSKKYARSYAGNIHRYYKEKKGWLSAFHSLRRKIKLVN